MWGVSDYKIVHRLDKRKHQLDRPVHHEVILSHIFYAIIKNSLFSAARRRHVGWVPASLPNSIVLLGGEDNAAELTAEIVPGFEK